MADGNIKLEECRVCGSKELYNYLDLGRLPLANRFLKKPGEDEPRFPLEVLYCKECSLSQLSLAVDSSVLFSYYPYRSSVSKTFQLHCSAMADEAGGYYPDTKNTLVVDIASNDGCLLNEFRGRGFQVLGVDPAKNLVEISVKRGVPAICKFWGEDAANEIIKRGKARIITATNVFAHVHDVNGFLENAGKAIDEGGMLIFEFHYGWELIKNTAFDTIYHEHHSYFILRPIKRLFEKHGLRIFDAKIFPIHGGALRVYAVKNGNKAFKTKDSVAEILGFEEKNGLYDIKTYLKFAKKVGGIKREFLGFLEQQKKAGTTVAGFGAAAKGNTLLNYCGVDSSSIKFIVDETPEKQGLYYAGTDIPIVGIREIAEKRPGYLVIFPWNFSLEIIRKVDKIGEFKKNGGKYVIPIPHLMVISGESEL